MAMPTDKNDRRQVIGTRILEAIIITVATTALNSYVNLKLVEDRYSRHHTEIQGLKNDLRDTTVAVNRLTTTASGIEIKTEERSRVVEARLRTLEERRR